MSRRRHEVGAIAVLLLGLVQLLGFLSGSRILRGIGAASCASPLPKVFSAHRGIETFANEFELVYELDGQQVRQPITPELYGRLGGPYNRRNVYGAALAFGPLLPDRILEPIIAYATAPGGPFEVELGLPAEARELRIVIRTKTAGRNDEWTLHAK